MKIQQLKRVTILYEPTIQDQSNPTRNLILVNFCQQGGRVHSLEAFHPLE